MISVFVTEEIGRPRGEVFDFVNDPSKVPLWQPSVISAEGIPGMPEGSEIVFDTQFLGRRSKMVIVIVENDGKSLTRSRSVRGPVKFETIYAFKEISPERTRVEVRVQIDAGMVYKLAEPALQSISRTIVESDLKLAKAILEQG